MNLGIRLEDCLEGLSETVEIPRNILCRTCDGSGAKPGTSPVTCRTCNGHGQVIVNRGFIRMQSTCPDCRGAGKIIEHPCTVCSGTGMETLRDKITVKIPAGVEDGMKLRITGKGEESTSGGEPGDLYVVLIVDEHPRLVRRGTELIGEIDVSMIQACLGGEVEFDGLDGVVSVQIPSGTQPDDVIRVSGKGLPKVGGSRRGDLHLRTAVSIPKALSDEQKGLLQELARSFGS